MSAPAEAGISPLEVENGRDLPAGGSRQPEAVVGGAKIRIHFHP